MAKKQFKGYHLVLVCAGGLVCAVILSLSIVIATHHAPKKQITIIASPSLTTSSSSASLTAGGVAVPAAYQARARRVGYYCLSWDAAPGSATSNTCMPLDKASP
jgi:hypothetical protein